MEKEMTKASASPHLEGLKDVAKLEGLSDEVLLKILNSLINKDR